MSKGNVRNVFMSVLVVLAAITTASCGGASWLADEPVPNRGNLKPSIDHVYYSNKCTSDGHYVSFTFDAHSNAGGVITSYLFDPGDGSYRNVGSSCEFKYPSHGTYTARLKVEDDSGFWTVWTGAVVAE